MQSSEINPVKYHCITHELKCVPRPEVYKFKEYALGTNSFQISDNLNYISNEQYFNQPYNSTSEYTTLNSSIVTSINSHLDYNFLRTSNTDQEQVQTELTDSLSYLSSRFPQDYCVYKTSESPVINSSHLQHGFKYQITDTKCPVTCSNTKSSLHTAGNTDFNYRINNLIPSIQEFKSLVDESGRITNTFDRSYSENEFVFKKSECIQKSTTPIPCFTYGQNSYSPSCLPVLQTIGSDVSLSDVHQQKNLHFIQKKDFSYSQTMPDSSLSWLDVINEDLLEMNWPEDGKEKYNAREEALTNSSCDSSSYNMSEYSQKHRSVQVAVTSGLMLTSDSFGQQCEKELERRRRNNEASRKSRAMKKRRFEAIEAEAQLLSATNNKLRILLKEINAAIREANDYLSVKTPVSELLAAML